MKRLALVALLWSTACAYDMLAEGKWIDDRGEVTDDMVLVPAGKFLMGCNYAQNSWCDNTYSASGDPVSLPQVEKDLPSFYIDRNEVTIDAFSRCVRAEACDMAGDNPYAVESLQLPAFVPADVGEKYCTFLGKRLPSEAEWEKAARGPDGRMYPWGDSAPTCELANGPGCAGKAEKVGSHPTGASPYGALDMAGNVSELVKTDNGIRNKGGGHDANDTTWITAVRHFPPYSSVSGAIRCARDAASDATSE